MRNEPLERPINRAERCHALPRTAAVLKWWGVGHRAADRIVEGIAFAGDRAPAVSFPTRPSGWSPRHRLGKARIPAPPRVSRHRPGWGRLTNSVVLLLSSHERPFSTDVETNAKRVGRGRRGPATLRQDLLDDHGGAMVQTGEIRRITRTSGAGVGGGCTSNRPRSDGPRTIGTPRRRWSNSLK